MKKLFTLLTLLLGVASGAWAMGETFEVKYNGAETNSFEGFFSHDTSGKFNFNDAYYGKFEGTEIKKGLKMEGSTKITFTTEVKSTLTIVQCNHKNGTGNTNTIKLDGTELAISDATEPSGSENVRVYSIENLAAGDHNITRGSGENGLLFIRVVYTEESTSPELSVSTKALSLAVTPTVSAKSAKFTLTGKNLTNGTYELSVPAVTGLSVTPSNFTVADGTVNQEFTVSYTSTIDVEEAVANISATVDGVTAEVAVTYSAHTTLYTLTAVSAATTWDFSKITVNTSSERYGDNGIKLTAETTPTYTDEIVYENYNGSDFTIASGFDGTTMAFTGQYPIRNNNMCQAGTLHFKTTVPGVITVKFSDTGSSIDENATPRYLIVNGCQTQYWTSRPTSGTTKSNDTKTSGEIYVPAGDVTITGSKAICMYIVTFTPTSEIPTTTVTVSDKGYRTFASKYPLDFSTPVSGLKVYKATLTENIVSFSEVTTAVPAGEGLLLKGEGEFTLNIATVRPEAIDNALIGVTVEKTVDAGIFVLMDGAQGVGFYKTTSAFTVGANTAYLPALPAPANGEARAFIALDVDGGETTGIEGIAAETMSNGEVYNLQGQRVVKAQKGLYIMNGKKVLVK